MDFHLTPEQELFRKSAREFAEKELEPLAATLDREHRFPIESLRKLGELGYLGMSVPESYGGINADALSYALVMEELSRACASTSTAVSVQNSLVNDVFVKFADEPQKRKYLPKLASGQWIGAFGLTEPESGSDAGAMKTTALREGKGYALNGAKRFITNAAFADVFIVFATTDAKLKHRGVSCFVVNKETEGFSVGKEEDKLGICGTSTCELHFDRCRVGEEHRIGPEGVGFKAAMVTLNSGRIGIAAQALGIAQAAFDEALKYAKEREAFGQKISHFQSVQFKLADMKAQLEAARLLVYRAAWKKDQGQDFSVDSAIAKLVASETASQIADQALQIHGGYGYIKDYKVERLYRDARITRIYEGTSEIQKLIISRSLLD